MTESVPLPPPAAPAEATPAARGPDAILAGVVVAFAFLAASFAARNSDLWLHLAAGRLVAHNEYAFGSDPFAYTTEGVSWANHAWLFDLILYAGYQTLGGAGLVVLKAAVVAVLAGLMLRIARHRGPFWVTAACTLLAVLAMSPRLLLQPICLSLLLVAVCLWLLTTGGRALYALPVVIALWANLDGWFLLGPLLVGLFAAGEWLAPTDTSPRRVPLWLLPACLAACLLTPYHVHGLTLPAELSPAVRGSELRQDVRFAPLFASPWRLGPLGPAGGYSLSAWAYFLLLFLGLVSFAVNHPTLRGWRGPVWLGFALLGAWQARLVPFFAVVAGPITALNLGERLSLAWVGLGRAVVLLAGLVLAALTWPGWLHGFNRHDRPLAWEVTVDPSLQRVTETLARWREQGILPAGSRTFAMHPDVAHYCAWFCPGEKGFLDIRLPLFVPVAADFERLCRALDPGLTGAGEYVPGSAAWPRTLRDYNIACVVLYDPDLRRLAPALRQVTQTPEAWSLLRTDGQAILVACGETGAGTVATPRFDAERAAFRDTADEAVPPAPDEGPPQLGRPPAWWDRYLDRPGGSSWETEAAVVYVHLFQDSAPEQLDRQGRAVKGRLAAGLLGGPAVPNGPLAAALGVAPWLRLEGVLRVQMAERPAALPLLGVRAARRAVAAHPDDATAWLVLGRAYLALGRTTAEANPLATLPPLSVLRYFQTVTALQQAVNLNPDLTAAHEHLKILYAEREYFDLALAHGRAHLRLVRQAGPLPGEEPAAFAGRVERLEQSVEQLLARVQDSQNRFVVRTYDLAADPLARARVAMQLGLPGKALDDVLLRSHSDLYGVEGIRLVLDLLLLTGRAQDARELLEREELRRNPDGLGVYELPGRPQGRRWGYVFPAYDWFDLCQAASAGNYARAAGALERMRGRMQRQGELMRTRLVPETARRLASEIGVGAVPAAVPLRLYKRLERDSAAALLVQNDFLLVERADLYTLEGMLLLERGRPQGAAAQFQRGLALYRQATDNAPAVPGRPLAVHYSERVRPTDHQVTK
jgi:tetratricopeptide (TPR) repeat protein